MAEQFPLRLVSSYMLAPAVRHLVFERADGQPFVFAPGQFIQVHFHYADGKPTKRSYSVATVGDGTAAPAERIEIAVSYVEGGAATALLSGLQPGDTISASGPYGRFCLFDADTNRRYLLVGTGTGITPYRAMLPQLRRVIAERGCAVDLIFGARNEGELLYDADFSAFEREVPGFRYHACLSRTTTAAACRSRWKRCSRRPTATSPTSAAIRTWSTRPSPCSRTSAWPYRTSGARNTSRPSEPGAPRAQRSMRRRVLSRKYRWCASAAAACRPITT